MMASPKKRSSTALSTGWSACTYPASRWLRALPQGLDSPSQMPATSVSPPPARGLEFPIARTLGNCLSGANLRRLCATLGVSWVKRMLLLAEMPTAESLLPIGYLEAVVPQEALDAEVARLCNRLLGHAPLTIAATRETLRRLACSADVDIADLIRACYGSTDFHRSAMAFGTGTRVDWEEK